jgi:uncharacterized protein YaaR (DUF327 family)
MIITTKASTLAAHTRQYLLSLMFLSVFVFSSSSSGEALSPGELALRYRILSNDYTSSPAVVNSVFSLFEELRLNDTSSFESLSQDRDFLLRLKNFSQSLSLLVSEQPSEEAKKNSLEGVMTVISDSVSEMDKTRSQSLVNIYQKYIDTFLKEKMVASGTLSEEEFKGIKIKRNEVIKTIGTYGIWGFWFVTSTWGLVQFSPKMEHFMYYPAVAMFLASGPYSISNQVWSQVFDRIEKKALVKHQTAVEYMKEKVHAVRRHLTFRKNSKNNYQCLKFYSI